MSDMCLQDSVAGTLTGPRVVPLQPLGYMENRTENMKKVLHMQGIDFEAHCTASTDSDCWILHNLTPWNKILCSANMELKEYRPGKLKLCEMNNDVRTYHTSGPLLDAAFVAYWLVKKHICIDFFNPHTLVVAQSSGAFKNALARNAGLRHFDYRWCGPWQHKDFYICEGVHLLKNIENLVLCHVEIKHEGAVLVAKMLEENQQIKKVNLTKNSLTYCGSATIFRALRGCLTLTELEFNTNRIGKKSMKYLSQLVARSQSLEKIALHWCTVSENSGIESLANALKVNTTVKEISFYDFTSCVEAIADALKENNSVRCAKFVKTGVQDENCSKLARMLEQNSTLEELHLSSNQIEDHGASVLAAGLRGNKTLRKLFLNGNDIGHRGLGRLIEALATNESVQLLDISSNPLEEHDSSTLSRALVSARAYGRVKLDWQDVDITELATVIASGSQLEDLELDCSWLSEEKLLEVLSSLYVSPSIKKLDIRGLLKDSLEECMAKVIATNKSIKSLVLNCVQPNFLTSLLHALKHNRTITKCCIDMEECTPKGLQAMVSVLRENTAITDLDINGLNERHFGIISKALGYNYTITNLDFAYIVTPNKNVFRIRQYLQRNLSLLNSAARFVLKPSVHKDRAQAFETLAHSEGLSEHLVNITSKNQEEITKLLCGAKDYVTTNYFRIVGVVKTKLECNDIIGHRGQIDQLNEVCLRRLLFYLRVTDVVAL